MVTALGGVCFASTMAISHASHSPECIVVHHVTTQMITLRDAGTWQYVETAYIFITPQILLLLHGRTSGLKAQISLNLDLFCSYVFSIDYNIPRIGATYKSTCTTGRH
jgi:hypothetical protein